MLMFWNEDEDEDGDESMHMDMMSWSWIMDVRAPMTSPGSDESLWFGDDEEVEFLILFLTVEFQKFFISLSVRPGKRAAICDHLHLLKKKKKKINIPDLQPICAICETTHLP